MISACDGMPAKKVLYGNSFDRRARAWRGSSKLAITVRLGMLPTSCRQNGANADAS